MTTALATAANPNPASFSVLIPLFAVGVALVLGWAWWVRSINLALGLASTVAMWTLAYVALLQPGFLAGELLFAGMVLCLVLGGARAARLRAAAQPGSPATHAHGLRVGLVSATVNLMVLGMFLRPEQGNTATQAALYASGLFAGSAILGWVGDIIGQRMRPAARTTDPSVLMAAVLAANILVMVVLGGLVTSLESGLAVPDWPNSFGHNMLLYPLSAMKGGIFYEHAHRLFGMLVGVTTLCTWMVVIKDQKRMLPRVLASLMVVLVITQGWLGGLSVTGNVTTSMNPADLAPNVKIRIAHAMLGPERVCPRHGLGLCGHAALGHRSSTAGAGRALCSRAARVGAGLPDCPALPGGLRAPAAEAAHGRNRRLHPLLGVARPHHHGAHRGHGGHPCGPPLQPRVAAAVAAAHWQGGHAHRGAADGAGHRSAGGGAGAPRHRDSLVGILADHRSPGHWRAAPWPHCSARRPGAALCSACPAGRHCARSTGLSASCSASTL
ncbi:MAG: COX15/CtaA family protein [Phycisphaerales bacterium]